LLETIARVEPELVLMDIQLPGKDGFALLSEIRESPHRGLRVLALTAHAMSGDRERAMQAGFDGYITKPIEIRSFPELVKRALAGEAVSH
jgi:two-component system cell cycle response regulator DivK